MASEQKQTMTEQVKGKVTEMKDKLRGLDNERRNPHTPEHRHEGVGEKLSHMVHKDGKAHEVDQAHGVTNHDALKG